MTNIPGEKIREFLASINNEQYQDLLVEIKLKEKTKEIKINGDILNITEPVEKVVIHLYRKGQPMPPKGEGIDIVLGDEELEVGKDVIIKK